MKEGGWKMGDGGGKRDGGGGKVYPLIDGVVKEVKRN